MGTGQRGGGIDDYQVYRFPFGVEVCGERDNEGSGAMNQVTLLWQEVLSALGLGLMLALVFDLAYYVSERFKEG